MSASRVQPDRYNTQFIEAMATYEFSRQFVPHDRIADIGCSFGYGSELLHAAAAQQVVGIDFDRVSLARAARAHPVISFIQADAGRIPLASQTFGCVCCFEVLHFLKQPKEALEEFRRILKPRGALLISTRRKDLSGIQTLDSEHINVMTPEEVAALLSAAGFDGIRLFGMQRPVSVYTLEQNLQSMRRMDCFGVRSIIPSACKAPLVSFIARMRHLSPACGLHPADYVIAENLVSTGKGIFAIAYRDNTT